MTEFHGERVKAPKCDHPWTYRYDLDGDNWICLKCSHRGHRTWWPTVLLIAFLSALIISGKLLLFGH